MVTFRQLGDLFGFTMEKEPSGTSRKRNSKEFGLQSLRGTLPQGPRLLRSGAQCLDMCTRLLPTPSLQGKATGQSMREKSSSLTWESSPSSHAQGWEEDQRR
ncbi:unnamed protein product [Microthlaspi erraticum]|uniref:Uncharacterized protein n=1 Tax=Microthlaspi erraticum TaxID=1685480 RepID=A0A6D2KL52_9BRAS|nr:unnamed protein product [Microthlaspi erraticum]